MFTDFKGIYGFHGYWHFWEAEFIRFIICVSFYLRVLIASIICKNYLRIKTWV